MRLRQFMGRFPEFFLIWLNLTSYLPITNFGAFAISPCCKSYLNFPGLWLVSLEIFVFSLRLALIALCFQSSAELKRDPLVLLRAATRSSTGRCGEHWPEVPFMVIWCIQGVPPRTLRWQQPKSSLWSKTTLLKYRKVVFLPCTYKMTIVSIPLQVSVKTGIPAREMPVWYLFLKSGWLSPFQTCMNTSI